MTNPLLCDKCGRDLESDDAISIIEGICGQCRRAEVLLPKVPATPPVAIAPTNPTGPRTFSKAQSFRIPQPPPTKPDPLPRAAPHRPAVTPEPRETYTPPLSASVAEPALDNTPRFQTSESDTEFPRLKGSAKLILPSQYYESGGSPRMQRRRHALAAGIVTGIVLSTTLAIYWIGNRQDVAIPFDRPRVKDVALTLRVVPAFANVSLNGEAIGPPDKHGLLRVSLPGDDLVNKTLEVSAEGYDSLKRPISAFAGAADATISLNPKPVQIAVTSTPTQAEIWINGQLKGTSPATVTADPKAGLALVLKKPGYADYARSVRSPENGETLKVNCELQRLSHIVQVNTDPPGAEIIVQGRSKGPAPVRIPVDSREIKEIEILARKDGYEQASTVVALPTEPTGQDQVAQLTLAPMPISIRFTTVPPGGRITLEDQDLGPSPVLAKFDRSQIGKLVKVVATRGAAYRGSMDYKVSETKSTNSASTTTVNIPMAFSGERMAFVICPHAPTRTDFATLLNQFSQQVHGLGGDQQFALFAAGENGTDKWPTDQATQPATTEQKVRAYDMIRNIRPAKKPQLTKALEEAMAVKPSSLFIFTGSDLNRAELIQFGEAFNADQVRVHIVSIISGEQDQWLAAWSKRHGGSFSLLGRDPMPALAATPDSD